jgi:ATP-binding cassette, subfamily C (CFTR/MRP), member 4
VIGTIFLVGLINPWAFLPGFVSVVFMLLVRYRFAPCSRDLKRLVGTTRSPIYSQLTSTIHGLNVIRSYRAENISSTEFLNHLTNNARVDYFIATLNRWSALRFDFVSMLFIALITVFAIVARTLRRQISPADIALTLSYSLNMMGLFQWTIRFVPPSYM